ncbi:MAG: PH domain-containing protein [Culicoidibacterales bacterium]
MGLFDAMMGNASAVADSAIIKDYLLPDETIVQAYRFFRDEIVLTTHGIYQVDVQGGTGKKVEVKFFPKSKIKSVSFETAGTMDLDVDIKIGVDGNTVFVNGVPYNAPISFKVPKAQGEQAKQIIRLVKQYYLS